MGPYSPENAKMRLELLRDYLVDEGYCARTAEDFDDGEVLTDEQVFKKCRQLLLEWAHARIFVFLREAMENSRLLGVYDEFVTATENLPDDELHTCAVFIEDGLLQQVSSMMRGRLDHFKELVVDEFSNDEELFNMAASFCFNLLYSLDV
jgi:hypothetical protein